MSDIVVLSDSNESVLSAELVDKQKNAEDKSEKKSSHDDFDLSDFEFPEIQFDHAINEDKTINLQNIHNKKNSYEESKNIRKQRKAKIVGKKNKDQVIKERLKRQEQLMKEKVSKALASKKSKNIKPGECMKFMEVVLDKGMENFAPFTDIVKTLIDANLQYSINAELISNSIMWKRNIENSYVNESNEICTTTDVEKVNQILIVWNWDETVTKIANDGFCASISSIRHLLPNYNIILVIFEIGNYFIFKNQRNNSDKRGKKNRMQKTSSKNNDKFKNSPEISRKQLETCLNEIQITSGCSSRLINNSEELALMVYQCTKAIAEIPHKLEKSTNLTNKFDWYVMGDNRNTVRVDKDGNGLKRLWQQQLCQFHLSSLEIAEAICSVYPSPAYLIEAYMNCTDNEGINLLKDIPIRRAAGPLTTVRKIGLELSKKIYLMFMSKDGENALS
ncbi:Crossover junction endonuclease EME1 [Habropoda laboriosa]|uniref:Crossover junction endonuclease EME1 n=1 Tax=Habropoda laboriosa TaxID=597456 RepID=A0A0L7QYK8_9HYME|nr:Crossover junction endonuclease EME1 [Habropoda laboriosa]